MNTPAHLLLGAAVFGKPQARSITLLAILGAVLPDLSLYILAGTSIYILGITPDHVFGTLYFSDAWQRVFAIDNSFVIWGALLALALWRKWVGVVAMCGGALLHLVLDFPLHHDDTRRHFWPLSDWEFQSPVSYWDPQHYGSYTVPLGMLVVIGAAIWVWRKFPGWPMRLFAALMLCFELFTGYMWLTFFSAA